MPKSFEVNRKTFIVIGAIVCCLLAIVATMYGCGSRRFSPDELAVKYVKEDPDKLGDTIAAVILSPAPEGAGMWLRREVGQEWVEGKVQKEVRWDFSSARSLADGEYEVTAAAFVSFNVLVVEPQRTIKATVPFRLLIDHTNQRVVSVLLFDDAKVSS